MATNSKNKIIIGVMGPGSKDAREDDVPYAYEVGKLVAKNNHLLLCGGMTGVMEASAKGASEGGGLVIGICPTADKKDANQYIDIPIVTGMGAGRNFMNILSSDILVFIGVSSPGTLSELAYAIQLAKPTIILRGNADLKNYVQKELKSEKVIFVETFIELEKKLEELTK